MIVGMDNGGIAATTGYGNLTWLAIKLASIASGCDADRFYSHELHRLDHVRRRFGIPSVFTGTTSDDVVSWFTRPAVTAVRLAVTTDVGMIEAVIDVVAEEPWAFARFVSGPPSLTDWTLTETPAAVSHVWYRRSGRVWVRARHEPTADGCQRDVLRRAINAAFAMVGTQRDPP